MDAGSGVIVLGADYRRELFVWQQPIAIIVFLLKLDGKYLV